MAVSIDKYSVQQIDIAFPDLDGQPLNITGPDLTLVTDPDAGADGPGVEVLLDAGQLLHPRHPGGEGGVLARGLGRGALGARARARFWPEWEQDHAAQEKPFANEKH